MSWWFVAGWGFSLAVAWIAVLLCWQMLRTRRRLEEIIAYLVSHVVPALRPEVDPETSGEADRAGPQYLP